MRILLTGSAGRVGTAVAAALAADHEVVGLDLAPFATTTRQGSINDLALVDELVSRVDAIVHVASLHAPHVGRVSEREFVDTNVRGTELLLETSLRHGVGRFIYTSTTSLYGHALVPVDRAVWVTEELAPRPRDIYDTTKIAAEEACRAAAGPMLSCASLRIARCFPEPAGRIAAYRLHRGVDLRDVAAAHRLALTAQVSGFDVFNVSALTPFLPEDAEELLHDARSVVARRCPGLVEDFRARGWALPASIDRVYAIDKAQLRLGYRPRYNFDSLLRSPHG